MYRATFKTKFEGKFILAVSNDVELIGFFFNVDWNSTMAVHDHPFFNFMFLAQVFIPPDCVLRKSLDSAIVEFSKK
jgi:hypothetical protein